MVSWLAVGLISAATFATMQWVRPGLPGAGDIEARLLFVSRSREYWVIAWFLRAAAATALLAALVSISRTLTPGYPVLRTVALHLACAGLVAELVAGSISALVVPALAERFLAGEVELLGVMEALEGISVALVALIATGLTAFSGALLCHAAYRTPPFPRPLAAVGLLVWAAGFLGAGATLAGSTAGLALVTMLYPPLLAFWVGSIAAVHFRPPGAAPPSSLRS